ncbi:MOSC domain-containing protein [Aquimarina sp. 2201CG5-10]|uniref:MOSC domain-containing protein n=1 Tax=Aquimarina callyspongiae TaxID=3098150 RepID=UPI002AB33AEF|nr:MOSC domain-containing protein [Aquimarina sp. 2201CG5-10]MDY8134272.1 MOSC domain-containing protein [Aquimarina sp. 2201CG5-10]
MNNGIVKSVSKSSSHTFSKFNCDRILLIKGLGVKGDAHMGEKVKHRSRVAKDPNQPNLRQVHLIHSELFDELKKKGFNIQDGEIGENITTKGVELLNLPKDTLLSIGETVKIKITGLRNPCKQLNALKDGLLRAVLDKDEKGNLIRKAGVMGIVLEGGEVRTGNKIIIELPSKPHIKLERV